MEEGSPGGEHADSFSSSDFSSPDLGAGRGRILRGEGKIVVSDVVNQFWEVCKCEVLTF